MKYGICSLSVVPMRANPAHESELVSELLFNDTYEVIEDFHEWIKIRCQYDSYEGWIRKLQHREIDENEHNVFLKKDKYIISSPVAYCNHHVLSFGSVVLEQTENSIAMRKDFSPAIMVESAMKLLGVPYRWGGKSVMGIDCSALVQLCAKAAGLKLPRDASQQGDFGDTIVSLSEAQSGDIAFFINGNKRITHVGILLSNNTIIHASGKVRIDRIDDIGIYNEDLKCHTHQLHAIKRLS